jgi:DNA-binding response OmpR family regulator
MNNEDAPGSSITVLSSGRIFAQRLRFHTLGALAMKLSGGSKGTILLLCSDGDVLSVLGDALEGSGYVVLPARNLGLAVDELGDCRPDLLIVRPYIDSMSGHEAALYLRTKCNGLRVLMVGGLPDDDRVVYREALRSVEVFPKPFTIAEFLEKVAAVMASGQDADSKA